MWRRDIYTVCLCGVFIKGMKFGEKDATYKAVYHNSYQCHCPHRSHHVYLQQGYPTETTLVNVYYAKHMTLFMLIGRACKKNLLKYLF